MSPSNCGVSVCPCCNEATLHPNGAFFTCSTCGLAITTQALIKAFRYTHDTTRLDQAMVISSN